MSYNSFAGNLKITGKYDFVLHEWL